MSAAYSPCSMSYMFNKSAMLFVLLATSVGSSKVLFAFVKFVVAYPQGVSLTSSMQFVPAASARAVFVLGQHPYLVPAQPPMIVVGVVGVVVVVAGTGTGKVVEGVSRCSDTKNASCLNAAKLESGAV